MHPQRGSFLKKICSQPYAIIERKIIENKLHIIKERSFIDLYRDKIATNNNVFHIKDVHDISYRKGIVNGILYLHTNQGVFPFKVLCDPSRFIEEYRKLHR